MTFLRHAVPALLILLAGGCGQSGGDKAAQAPPTVSVVTLSTQPVTLTTELPGRIVAYETSEVRPQVNGLVEARLFTEGSYVRLGQPLYRIDAAPYRAQAASARAALAKAVASLGALEAQARRYGELVRINAVSRQDYDNAVSSAAQARAEIAAQRAALNSAQIDVGRTVVRAPISGQIGRSLTTTGSLVAAGQATALATIQRIDQVYVDIPQSSADVLKLRQAIIDGKMASGGRAPVSLVLENGRVYPLEGSLLFADVTVDQQTGSQVIRALFQNPQNLLLPGMFVRARLVSGTVPEGLLVPQRAVSRDERGRAVVFVVGKNNQLEQRSFETAGTMGDQWIVAGGLRPGDRVVVEGAMMLRPGTAVTAKPWDPGAPAINAQGGTTAQRAGA